MLRFFLFLLTLVVRAIRVAFRPRSDVVLENIALRQQVGVLTKRRPRPQLDDADRAFWVAMRTAWRGWAERLILVEPETVVKWHRERFRGYWTELSRHQLREAFPFDTAPRYLIFDRDSIFSKAVVGFVESMGTKPC